MTRTLIALLAVLSIGIAGTALAQNATTTPATQTAENTGVAFSTATGTIVESTGTSLTIRTETGEQMSFTVDGASHVLSTLPPDRRVSVKYETTPSGSYHVMNVDVAAPAPAKTAPAGADETTMPQTASPLPLVGLAGLAALVLGATLALAVHRREPRS